MLQSPDCQQSIQTERHRQTSLVNPRSWQAELPPQTVTIGIPVLGQRLSDQPRADPGSLGQVSIYIDRDRPRQRFLLSYPVIYLERENPDPSSIRFLGRETSFSDVGRIGPRRATHPGEKRSRDDSRSQQHCTPPFLLRLQGLLTLFTEFFASFDHSTSALSVPGLYASLRWIHIALQTAVPSHSTRGYDQPHPNGSQRTAKFHTGQSPCVVVPFQDSSWR